MIIFCTIKEIGSITIFSLKILPIPFLKSSRKQNNKNGSSVIGGRLPKILTIPLLDERSCEYEFRNKYFFSSANQKRSVRFYWRSGL